MLEYVIWVFSPLYQWSKNTALKLYFITTGINSRTNFNLLKPNGINILIWVKLYAHRRKKLHTSLALNYFECICVSVGYSFHASVLSQYELGKKPHNPIKFSGKKN